MKVIKRIVAFIQDPNKALEERLFVLLPMLTEIAVFLVFIGDILCGENILEILILLGTLILNPVIVYVCLKWHKVDTGSSIIAVLVVFVIMPVVFFFGGGPDGGGILWFTYCAIYVGLLVKGRLKTILLFLLFASAAADYAIAWYHPEFIHGHGRGMYYIDSLLSVFAVGIFAYFMILFQNNMYRAESERAMKEASRVEQLNASRNAFFANMSHEIRTPINTILGLNEMILRDEVSDEVKEDAESIQGSGKLLLALINDILDLSKLQSGQMRIVPSQYRTGEMIREIVAMLAPKAKEKGLEFTVNIAPDVPSGLYGDEMRIRQILINVLNNAIKYTNKGKVSLDIHTGRDTGDGLPIIFTVTDTGIGIKKEDMPYLFSAFKRVDENQVHHIEGTGLGLSIVKQLTDIMGGRITVDSVYTKGSVFIIEIPQRVTDERGIEENAGDIHHDTNTGSSYLSSFEAPEARVLIVDDNASNLLVERKLLKSTRVIADEAKSGREALEKTLETAYQVILMDHLMPEMDGIECQRRIRQQKGGLSKNAKIVALTANAGEDHKRLFEQAGFDGYLTKPVSGEELEREVARLLPQELITVKRRDENVLLSTVKWMNLHEHKAHLMITTESVADLPEELIKKYEIGIISHKVRTDRGVFRDGKEIDAKGLLNYLQKEGAYLETSAASVQEHEEFFADMLERAEKVIHIAVSGHVEHSGCKSAAEAAKSFDNVYVVDSAHLSSGQGILVLEAAKMAKKGFAAEDIIKQLEILTPKIHTSFVTGSLKYLIRAGQVGAVYGGFLNSLMAHPVLVMKNGRIKMSGIYFGTNEYAQEAYMKREMRRMQNADKGTLFITYAGMEADEILRIRKLVSSRVKFDNIYMVQASPAISANCGPKTFGFLYRK
ncbi:MAG: DegV family EDD domain-containing protein [Lachnospiraceae bacterium]|nr:DegV family EDD domain-containing protein [Lachnospiraceae bacterium]